MDDSNPQGLSIEEGVLALRQSREDQAKPETTTDEPEVETEEVTDETEEVETQEVKAEEVEGDQPEEDIEEDAEPKPEEDEVYELGGIEFTASELKEWKENGLRNADYTQKNQARAEKERQLEADRAAFNAEREQGLAQLQQQQAQLQEALATYAIEQDPEPNPSKFPDWKQYAEEKSAWDERNLKKQQARQALEGMRQQQHQELVRREHETLMGFYPEWRTPEVFQEAATKMVGLGTEYGFSAEEIGAMSDHRYFRILKDLGDLRAATNTQEVAQKAAAKKVVKATKKLTPGAKPEAQSQGKKAVRQARDQLRKTGTAKDALALLKAQRAARG